MLKIDAKKIGIELLNTILEIEYLDLEIHDRVLNALILLDPQEEEQALFYGALKYAGNIIDANLEALEETLNKFEA